jgi:hypothetical protein
LECAVHLAAGNKPEPLKAQAIYHLARDDAEGVIFESGDIAYLCEGRGDLGQMRCCKCHMVGKTRVLHHLLAAA